MALLFSLTDATAQDDPEYGRIEAGPGGGFDFPDELSDILHRVHHRGRKAWETQTERQARLHGEDLARRRDPAALYDAVGEFTAAMKAAAAPAVNPDVAALLAQVQALTARLSELEESAATPDEGSGPAAKPARSRGTKGAPAGT